MKKRVTIQDIADALELSRNTVSKAINNSEGIADDTREKVLQKAIELGYKQFSYVNNLAGVSAASAGLILEANHYQGEIALLTTRYLNHSHFASIMLDRFQQEISQLGFTMSTHRVTPDNLINKVLPITLNTENVKGILCIEMFDRDYDEMLCGLDIPILFIDGPAIIDGHSLPADQIYMDNRIALTQFLHDMHEQGITKIGFIGDYEHCESFYERYLTTCVTQMLAGNPMDTKYIIKSNFYEEILKQLSTMDELPELFICANDFLALDAIESLRALGKQIPDDVLICGFDDSSESRHSQPPLTTIHIHTQVIAYTAISLLLSRMTEPSIDYRTVYTESYLITRDSTDLSRYHGRQK